MKNKVLLLIVLLFSILPLFPAAQRVWYSPFVGNPSTTRFEVMGKAGDFYWVMKSKKNTGLKKQTEPWLSDKDLSFEIYDARMNEIKTIPYALSDTVLKEYFVAGNEYFDQLLFTSTHNKTRVVLNRYTPEGELMYENHTLTDLPGTIKSNDVLLIRSQDKDKLLLLGFERRSDAPPQLHAVLYTSNWKILFQTVYKNPNLIQPFIQYDFINYPSEHFDNSPVKLSNNGDWLMIAPSQTNNNYLLSYFNLLDSTFAHAEIKLTQNAGVENLVLSVDNDKGEAFAGILLNTRLPSVKKARVAHYLLSQCRFDFDTTYRFNTSPLHKTRDENLFAQYFMMVPGKGFMLLKEHGRPYTPTYINEELLKEDEAMELNSITNTTPVAIHKNDYTRFSNLTSRRSKYDRGDLSLFFFPATPDDTCWSGIINQEQTADLNSAYLSYSFIAVEGKLFFLYNSQLNNNKYSTTTILNGKGDPLNEGLVFWKGNNILDFQKARQISAKELAVPYERNGRNGFAVISL